VPMLRTDYFETAFENPLVVDSGAGQKLTAVTGFIHMVIKRRRTPSNESISLPPTIAYLIPNLVALAGDLVTGDAELQKCGWRRHFSGGWNSAGWLN
jgi:hypothetical protein